MDADWFGRNPFGACLVQPRSQARSGDSGIAGSQNFVADDFKAGNVLDREELLSQLSELFGALEQAALIAGCSNHLVERLPIKHLQRSHEGPTAPPRS